METKINPHETQSLTPDLKVKAPDFKSKASALKTKAHVSVLKNNAA
jgi:hypothetical protein